LGQQQCLCVFDQQNLIGIVQDFILIERIVAHIAFIKYFGGIRHSSGLQIIEKRDDFMGFDEPNLSPIGFRILFRCFAR